MTSKLIDAPIPDSEPSPTNDSPAKAVGQKSIQSVLEKLFELYPHLFGAEFLPLKLGIFQELLASHPEQFERAALKAALGTHTRSTRYLPFWVANLVERMGLAMGIILAIMLPLSRVIPPLYAFRVRSRIFRWYGQLRDIELRISTQDNRELLRELGQLESRAEKISVPLSYTDELYALRSNIHLVRKKLLRTEPEPA